MSNYYLIHMALSFYAFTILATLTREKTLRIASQCLALTLLSLSLWPLTLEYSASIGTSIWVASLTPIALVVALLKSYFPKFLYGLYPVR